MIDKEVQHARNKLANENKEKQKYSCESLELTKTFRLANEIDSRL